RKTATTPERRGRGPQQTRFWFAGVGGRGRLLVLLSLVSLAAVPAALASEKRAEKPYALIFGTVYAPNNRPAYGVRVRIRRADRKKAQWELYSDHQGEFAQRVPAGSADYIVRAEPEDKRVPKAEVKVHVQNDERVDIGLHLTR
ncbi:MAG TPA: hypothetical protein VES66_09390, partial [Terriglobales bacterium]|nr:hypothetical protein [Terriglobales bacterium]